MDKVINWISKVDYHARHRDIAKLRFKGTGEWFLKSAEYRAWSERRGGKLWVTAMRAPTILYGCGESTDFLFT